MNSLMMVVIGMGYVNERFRNHVNYSKHEILLDNL